MSERQIDWRAFLNRLTYCHGCGRFRLPRPGKKRPTGWTVLYQPHPEGPPGLNACSKACADDLRKALAKGPVTAPLRMATNVSMDSEMREEMMREAMQFAIDEGRLDDLFVAAVKDTEDQ